MTWLVAHSIVQLTGRGAATRGQWNAFGVCLISHKYMEVDISLVTGTLGCLGCSSVAELLAYIV